MPIIAHETIAGVDCCDCTSTAVEGGNIELRRNECGAVVGVVHIEDRQVARGLFIP